MSRPESRNFLGHNPRIIVDFMKIGSTKKSILLTHRVNVLAMKTKKTDIDLWSGCGERERTGKNYFSCLSGAENFIKILCTNGALSKYIRSFSQTIYFELQ